MSFVFVWVFGFDLVCVWIWIVVLWSLVLDFCWIASLTSCFTHSFVALFLLVFGCVA